MHERAGAYAHGFAGLVSLLRVKWNLRPSCIARGATLLSRGAHCPWHTHVHTHTHAHEHSLPTSARRAGLLSAERSIEHVEGVGCRRRRGRRCRRWSTAARPAPGAARVKVVEGVAVLQSSSGWVGRSCRRRSRSGPKQIGLSAGGAGGDGDGDGRSRCGSGRGRAEQVSQHVVVGLRRLLLLLLLLLRGRGMGSGGGGAPRTGEPSAASAGRREGADTGRRPRPPPLCRGASRTRLPQSRDGLA
mmetsp:Transcript_3309/g.13633  ORF Transcript_3309/g.13633 Transcript_3309/m.13633 type:complete len:245 (+) Transcript_3309:2914-3648(+)